MSVTRFSNLDAVAGRIPVVSTLPTAPSDYYGAGAVGFDEWQGGEAVYYTSDEKLYIQQSTSGRTATWRKLDSAFATSTTSSSTTSSSTTSSTTSSSTSTSTSTSSSSSSSSTSSSSTTTMA